MKYNLEMGKSNMLCIPIITITRDRGKQKTSSCPGPNRDAGTGNYYFYWSDAQNKNFADGLGTGGKETTRSSGRV
jgi:hypothetical protein